MKKQLFLFMGLLTQVAFSYAQVTTSVMSNKGDKISLSDIKVEPWQVQGTTDKATGNALNIYQVGKVGIGNFATEIMKPNEIFRTEKGDINFRGEEALFANMYNTYASNTPANANGLLFQRSRGTLLAPLDVQAGDVLGTVNFMGYQTGAFNKGTFFQVKQGALNKHNIIEFTSNAVSASDLYLRFNDDRSTTIGNLIDGSDAVTYNKVVVANTNGTLGVVDRSTLGSSGGVLPPTNTTQYAYKLLIPPTHGTVSDFNNHANTAYDSDGWWIISKSSIGSGSISPVMMRIVYEFQGTALPDVNKILPTFTAGNNSNVSDSFSISFNSISTVANKTRIGVTVVRVDNRVDNWAGSFFMNAILSVKQ